MFSQQKAEQFIGQLYDRLYRGYQSDEFSKFYAPDARWYTHGVSFGYDEMYQHFVLSKQDGFLMNPVVHRVEPTAEGISVLVNHQRLLADGELDREVNTMANLTIKDDHITEVSFMWSLPVEQVMSYLRAYHLPVFPKLEIQELLTSSELRCFLYAIRGYSAKEVAEKLCRSPRTVESHFVQIKSKLGLAKITDCIEYAIQTGILKLLPILEATSL